MKCVLKTTVNYPSSEVLQTSDFSIRQANSYPITWFSIFFSSFVCLVTTVSLSQSGIYSQRKEVLMRLGINGRGAGLTVFYNAIGTG